MNAIAVFETNTREYDLLTACAKMLTMLSPTHKTYRVGITYFDFGQDWKWTTILANSEYGGYQALNPAEQEKLFACESEEDILRVAESVLSDKYCPDRIRH